MKRAAIYCRVSSAEQAGEQHVSLEVQQQRCRAYVAQHGWSLVTVETDTESGLKATRVGYQRVIELARSGAVDVVVVMAASRFGRKASEVLVRVEELRGLGVELVSTAEDLTSFLMLGIQAVLNEEESRRLSERVGPAKRLKASKGYWLGHAPFGTVNVKGVLEPGPHFDLVRLAFQLAADGVALREINRRLNAALAPRSLHLTTVRKMLHNVAYIGRVRWDDVDAPALWDAMIDPALFDTAIARQTRRYRERAPLSTSYPFWLVGLAVCGRCGHRMHPKIHVKRWGTQYAYLICGLQDSVAVRRGCHGTHYLIDDAQAWVLDQVRALQLDRASAEQLVDRIAGAEDAQSVEFSRRRGNLQAERNRLTARLQAAKAAHLDAPLTFTIADVKQVEAAVRDNIQAIDRELARPAPPPSRDAEELRAFLLDAAWLDLADTDPTAFRDLLRRYVQRIVIRDRGDYAIEWRRCISETLEAYTRPRNEEALRKGGSRRRRRLGR